MKLVVVTVIVVKPPGYTVGELQPIEVFSRWEYLRPTGPLTPLPEYTDLLWVAGPPGAIGWGEGGWAVIKKPPCPTIGTLTQKSGGCGPPAAVIVNVAP